MPGTTDGNPVLVTADRPICWMKKKLCNQHHSTNRTLLPLNDAKQGQQGPVEVIPPILLPWAAAAAPKRCLAALGQTCSEPASRVTTPLQPQAVSPSA